MEYLLLVSIIFLSVFLAITIVNVVKGPMLKNSPGKVGSYPKVSALVPARNEEENISACLSGLIGQNYPDLEIIVLDDASSDRTAEYVREFSHKYHRIRLISGKPLPEGWTGKNWACHQLGMEAKGEIIIFIDADTHHNSHAIKNTVEWMYHLKLAMLSAFPQQKTYSLSEKMIVPMIDVMVYGSLPLWSTYHSKSKTVSAANGQWMAFTMDAYQSIGGHQSIKNKIVDDIELVRLAKQKGQKVLTTAGTDIIFCRMYHSPAEVWGGFSRSIYGLTGYNIALFSIIIMVMYLSFVLPYSMLFVTNQTVMAIFAVGLNISIRILQSAKFKHPFLASTLFHPLNTIVFILIGINSFLKSKSGKITWKGREIQQPSF